MTGKFIRRTLRNVVLRDRPYFAHLALTHRCNLRCRFCQIQETRFDELDTAGMKRVIDVLDRLGVGVVSVSGGGEPLLRGDFDEIVDYAASRGLYTKLTSNGTMPRERYRRLLASRIREIGISLDGVEGSDLPFSHCGPRLLDTIRYLHDNLPEGKQLTLNVTVSERNRLQVQHILDYCAREFPKTKVWLNPIVSGSGKLRTAALAEIEPSYLDECQSPTLLRARFYNDGVKRQWSQAGNWGCRAGRMFFDVKPNGDLWACQDVPSPTRLNLLDRDFEQRFRRAPFTRGHACSGCTYSCYMVTQQGLDPRNWKDMAGLWWGANTLPGDPCRQAAQRAGWVAGLLCLVATRFRSAVAAAAVCILLMTAAGLARGEATPALIHPDDVIERMEKANAARESRLPGFAGVRTSVRKLVCCRQAGEEQATGPGRSSRSDRTRVRVLRRVCGPDTFTVRGDHPLAGAQVQVRAGLDSGIRRVHLPIQARCPQAAGHVAATMEPARHRRL